MLWLILASWLSFCLVRADDNDNPDDFFQFVTRPDIEAPKWDINIYDEDKLQQGHYCFIAPYANLSQVEFPLWNGPLIYDTSGELIWSGAPYLDYQNTFDFRVSEAGGQRVLSFISGKRFTLDNNRRGNGYLLDTSYEVYTVVDMIGNSSRSNLHEFNLIDNGKRALMILPPTSTAMQINVSKYNGSCEIGVQGFKEVDVETGEIYFEWHTQSHIGADESSLAADGADPKTWKEHCARKWDMTHINSVDKFDNGDYLFSSRYTDTLYKISHKDRSIIWRLGGLQSDFVLQDQIIKFAGQHHARVRGQNETHTLISLFNNAVRPGSQESEISSASAGLLVALRTDVTPMTAELVARFEKPPIEDVDNYTRSRGSMSFLSNGNAFIGWVLRSYISEYAPDGKLLMTAILKGSRPASYRSFKMPWVGRPVQPPDVVAAAEPRAPSDDLTTIVYVSWNGATEVATWNLLRTNNFGNISELVASSPRQSFETKLTLDGFAKHVIAVALDVKGEELGRSNVVTVDLPPGLQTSTSLADSENEWINNHSSAWWEAPFANRATTLEKFEWFLVGFVSCVVLCCFGIRLWLWRRKRTTWWAARPSMYKFVSGSEEDEMDQQQAWMLDEKEGDEMEEGNDENGNTRREGG